MAANDIDKGLAQAPKGLSEMMDEMATQEPDIEIEIEDPESVSIKAGGMEIEIDPDAEDDFGKNLAEDIDEETLAKLADELLEDYEGDLTARRDWLDT